MSVVFLAAVASAAADPVIDEVGRLLSIRVDGIQGHDVRLQLVESNPNLVRVVIDGVSLPAVYRLSDYDDIFVHGSRGNDRIVVDETRHVFPEFPFVSFFGSAGNDILIGGHSRNQLEGDDGDDVIDGGEGIDLVDGGAGNDVVRGGGGDDIVRGGVGSDLVGGGAGLDDVRGDAGNDRIVWAPGDGVDRLDGGVDDDTFVLTGSPFADRLSIVAQDGLVAVLITKLTLALGNTEHVAVFGADGDDAITVGPGLKGIVDVQISGDRGADMVTASATSVTRVSGGTEIDTVIFDAEHLPLQVVGQTIRVDGTVRLEHADVERLTFVNTTGAPTESSATSFYLAR